MFPCPINLKVVSATGVVSDCEIPLIAPRHASNPPKVTINAGILKYAVRNPCRIPMTIATAIAAANDGNNP